LSALVTGWLDLETDRTRWARQVLSSFDSLPRELRSTIESRAQQGDTSIPDWRDETESEMRQRKFLSGDPRTNIIQQQVRIERGPLVGLKALRRERRVDTLLDSRIPTLLAEAKSLLDSNTVSTNELAAAHKSLADAPQEIEASVKQLTLFVTQR